jgi:PIN domain nuclease of toxin-antitoxin system
LPSDASSYVPAERQRHLIEPLPLDEIAVLALSRLPALHRDPFDRMLVCQSITHGMTLVTPDREIRQYPVPTFW